MGYVYWPDPAIDILYWHTSITVLHLVTVCAENLGSAV